MSVSPPGDGRNDHIAASVRCCATAEENRCIHAGGHSGSHFAKDSTRYFSWPAAEPTAASGTERACKCGAMLVSNVTGAGSPCPFCGDEGGVDPQIAVCTCEPSEYCAADDCHGASPLMLPWLNDALAYAIVHGYPNEQGHLALAERQSADAALASVRHIGDDIEQVVLTPEQANAICETLIEMAVRLPMKHRNHYDALVALGWEPHGST